MRERGRDHHDEESGDSSHHYTRSEGETSHSQSGDVLASRGSTEMPPAGSHAILVDLKRHIVQLEVITLATIFFLSLLLIRPFLETVLGSDVAVLLPIALLALLPVIAPVVNPESRWRAIIKYGTAGLGTGAAIGGAIAGTLSGGLGAPAGSLIGAGIGFLFGAVTGPILDGTKKILTQGEAREYLIIKRKRFPDLSLATIVAATEHPPTRTDCYVYMFVSDGVIKCTQDEVLRWLKSGCWRQKPAT